jgi:hypothetical protein
VEAKAVEMKEIASTLTEKARGEYAKMSDQEKEKARIGLATFIMVVMMTIPIFLMGRTVGGATQLTATATSYNPMLDVVPTFGEDFDIASMPSPMEVQEVEILKRTLLNWKIGGTETEGTTSVSVFIDGELRSTQTVDNVGGKKEMNVDVRPVDQGLHSFLIVATTSGSGEGIARAPHSTHVAAQFYYDLPTTPPSVTIMSPSDGQRVMKGNFKGLVFDSSHIPHDALAQGWYIDLVLDEAESFKVPFYEGLINMEGLGRGEHTCMMGVFDGDQVYMGGKEEVTFEII